MHWRISTFVELEHLSADDRKQLLRKHCGVRTMAMLVAFSIFLGGFLAFVVTITLTTLSGGASDPRWVLAVSWLVCGIVVYQVQIARIRRALRDYLAKRAQTQSLPLCLHCGYNLTGLVSVICPECGNIQEKIEDESEIAHDETATENGTHGQRAGNSNVYIPGSGTGSQGGRVRQGRQA